jgi:hypothetical protein
MSSTPPTETSGITDIEMEQLDRANASDRTPAVFIHGLWLLPSSWDRWAALFEDAGYIALTPGWPDDPNTVEEANADPGVFANKIHRADSGWRAVADRALEFIKRFAR